MLRIANATIGYPRHEVASGIDLEIEHGNVIALVAPNGSGKTTLLKALSGKGRTLQAGEVDVDGTTPVRSREYSRKVFFASPGDSPLESEMTLREHLATIAELWEHECDAASIAKRAGVEGLLNIKVKRMSQGMRQLSVIACALATGADYLLFDEPLNGLDLLKARAATHLLGELAREGKGLVVSSHIFAGLEDVATELAFLTPAGLQIHPTTADWQRLFVRTYRKEETPSCTADICPTTPKHWRHHD